MDAVHRMTPISETGESQISSSPPAPHHISSSPADAHAEASSSPASADVHQDESFNTDNSVHQSAAEGNFPTSSVIGTNSPSSIISSASSSSGRSENLDLISEIPINVTPELAGMPVFRRTSVPTIYTHSIISVVLYFGSCIDLPFSRICQILFVVSFGSLIYRMNSSSQAEPSVLCASKKEMEEAVKVILREQLGLPKKVFSPTSGEDETPENLLGVFMEIIQIAQREAEEKLIKREKKAERRIAQIIDRSINELKEGLAGELSEVVANVTKKLLLNQNNTRKDMSRGRKSINSENNEIISCGPRAIKKEFRLKEIKETTQSEPLNDQDVQAGPSGGQSFGNLLDNKPLTVSTPIDEKDTAKATVPQIPTASGTLVTTAPQPAATAASTLSVDQLQTQVKKLSQMIIFFEHKLNRDRVAIPPRHREAYERAIVLRKSHIRDLRKEGVIVAEQKHYTTEDGEDERKMLAECYGLGIEEDSVPVVTEVEGKFTPLGDAKIEEHEDIAFAQSRKDREVVIRQKHERKEGRISHHNYWKTYMTETLRIPYSRKEMTRLIRKAAKKSSKVKTEPSKVETKKEKRWFDKEVKALDEAHEMAVDSGAGPETVKEVLEKQVVLAKDRVAFEKEKLRRVREHYEVSEDFRRMRVARREDRANKKKAEATTGFFVSYDRGKQQSALFSQDVYDYIGLPELFGDGVSDNSNPQRTRAERMLELQISITKSETIERRKDKRDAIKKEMDELKIQLEKDDRIYQKIHKRVQGEIREANGDIIMEEFYLRCQDSIPKRDEPTRRQLQAQKDREEIVIPARLIRMFEERISNAEEDLKERFCLLETYVASIPPAPEPSVPSTEVELTPSVEAPVVAPEPPVEAPAITTEPAVAPTDVPSHGCISEEADTITAAPLEPASSPVNNESSTPPLPPSTTSVSSVVSNESPTTAPTPTTSVSPSTINESPTAVPPSTNSASSTINESPAAVPAYPPRFSNNPAWAKEAELQTSKSLTPIASGTKTRRLPTSPTNRVGYRPEINAGLVKDEASHDKYLKFASKKRGDALDEIKPTQAKDKFGQHLPRVEKSKVAGTPFNTPSKKQSRRERQRVGPLSKEEFEGVASEGDAKILGWNAKNVMMAADAYLKRLNEIQEKNKEEREEKKKKGVEIKKKKEFEGVDLRRLVVEKILDKAQAAKKSPDHAGADERDVSEKFVEKVSEKKVDEESVKEVDANKTEETAAAAEVKQERVVQKKRTATKTEEVTLSETEKAAPDIKKKEAVQEAPAAPTPSKEVTTSTTESPTSEAHPVDDAKKRDSLKEYREPSSDSSVFSDDSDDDDDETPDNGAEAVKKSSAEAMKTPSSRNQTGSGYTDLANKFGSVKVSRDVSPSRAPKTPSTGKSLLQDSEKVEKVKRPTKVDTEPVNAPVDPPKFVLPTPIVATTVSQDVTVASPAPAPSTVQPTPVSSVNGSSATPAPPVPAPQLTDNEADLMALDDFKSDQNIKSFDELFGETATKYPKISEEEANAIKKDLEAAMAVELPEEDFEAIDEHMENVSVEQTVRDSQNQGTAMEVEGAVEDFDTEMDAAPDNDLNDTPINDLTKNGNESPAKPIANFTEEERIAALRELGGIPDNTIFDEESIKMILDTWTALNEDGMSWAGGELGSQGATESFDTEMGGADESAEVGSSQGPAGGDVEMTGSSSEVQHAQGVAGVIPACHHTQHHHIAAGVGHQAIRPVVDEEMLGASDHHVDLPINDFNDPNAHNDQVMSQQSSKTEEPMSQANAPDSNRAPPPKPIVPFRFNFDASSVSPTFARQEQIAGIQERKKSLAFINATEEVKVQKPAGQRVPLDSENNEYHGFLPGVEDLPGFQVARRPSQVPVNIGEGEGIERESSAQPAVIDNSMIDPRLLENTNREQEKRSEASPTYQINNNQARSTIPSSFDPAPIGPTNTTSSRPARSLGEMGEGPLDADDEFAGSDENPQSDESTDSIDKDLTDAINRPSDYSSDDPDSTDDEEVERRETARKTYKSKEFIDEDGDEILPSGSVPTIRAGYELLPPGKFTLLLEELSFVFIDPHTGGIKHISFEDYEEIYADIHTASREFLLDMADGGFTRPWQLEETPEGATEYWEWNVEENRFVLREDYTIEASSSENEDNDDDADNDDEMEDYGSDSGFPSPGDLPPKKRNRPDSDDDDSKPDEPEDKKHKPKATAKLVARAKPAPTDSSTEEIKFDEAAYQEVEAVRRQSQVLLDFFTSKLNSASTTAPATSNITPTPAPEAEDSDEEGSIHEPTIESSSSSDDDNNNGDGPALFDEAAYQANAQEALDLAQAAARDVQAQEAGYSLSDEDQGDSQPSDESISPLRYSDDEDEGPVDSLTAFLQMQASQLDEENEMAEG